MTVAESGSEPSPEVPDGIEGCEYAGPFGVEPTVEWIRGNLNGFELQIFGEVWNLKKSGRSVYFDLRSGSCAITCSLPNGKFNSLVRMTGEEPRNGDNVVVAGMLDYWSSSMRLSVHDWRVVGDGEMLSRREQAAARLEQEGLFTRQKRLTLPRRPRVIGVVTSAYGVVRHDILVKLDDIGYDGTVVWAFANVQNGTAVTQLINALKALERDDAVEVIIIARGGGSSSDLNTFWDEELCRTVANLSKPVISGIGHETDHTLTDDVAHSKAITPTAAAILAVPQPRADDVSELERRGRELRAEAHRGLVARLRAAEGLLRPIRDRLVVRREQLRGDAQQHRVSARRTLNDADAALMRDVLTLSRQVGQRNRTLEDEAKRLRRESIAHRHRVRSLLSEQLGELERMARELATYDPDRPLGPNEVVVTNDDGQVVVDPSALTKGDGIRLRFATGSLVVEVKSVMANSKKRKKVRR